VIYPPESKNIPFKVKPNTIRIVPSNKPHASKILSHDEAKLSNHSDWFGRQLGT